MRDEGLSPETEEVLRLARAGAPMPPAHRRRLKGAVLARVALAASASASATVAAGQASGAALGLVAKTVVGLALASSIGAGVTLALRPPRLHAEAHVSHVAVAAPEPSVEVVPVAVAAVAEAPPAPRAPPRVRHVAARHVGPAPSTLAAETSLLREADRAARAGDTATALARLDEHAARFPDGVLAPERVAEHLIVMCTLSAADPRAVGGFLSSHAGSPLAARVRRACAAKP